MTYKHNFLGLVPPTQKYTIFEVYIKNKKIQQVVSFTFSLSMCTYNLGYFCVGVASECQNIVIISYFNVDINKWKQQSLGILWESARVELEDNLFKMA